MEVQRISRGAVPHGRDTEADVQQLFVAEFPALVRTLTLIVHNRTAAEDLAQDAFVQLLRHWRRISGYEAPGAWLRRVAVRMAVREASRASLRLTPTRQGSAASGARNMGCGNARRSGRPSSWQVSGRWVHIQTGSCLALPQGRGRIS
jgi:hypothetical protein